VSAALDIARSEGPDAVTLRELARQLDVSPAAIYRHFPDRDAILAEVARRGREMLAGRMLATVKRVRHKDPAERSIRQFVAVGRSYLAFARDEPHLLAAAFLPLAAHGTDPEQPNPWGVLAAALDELVTTGAMPPERRAGAEVIAWSAVHGFATLRANGSFGTSGEPTPNEHALLEAIARSLELDARRRREHRSRGGKSSDSAV
jgi:AcrR family transcriptional regulator